MARAARIQRQATTDLPRIGASSTDPNPKMGKEANRCRMQVHPDNSGGSKDAFKLGRDAGGYPRRRRSLEVSNDDGKSHFWVRGPQGRTSQGTSPLESVEVSIAECAFRLCEEGRRGVRAYGVRLPRKIELYHRDFQKRSARPPQMFQICSVWLYGPGAMGVAGSCWGSGLGGVVSRTCFPASSGGRCKWQSS